MCNSSNGNSIFVPCAKKKNTDKQLPIQLLYPLNKNEITCSLIIPPSRICYRRAYDLREATTLIYNIY